MIWHPPGSKDDTFRCFGHTLTMAVALHLFVRLRSGRKLLSVPKLLLLLSPPSCHAHLRARTTYILRVNYHVAAGSTLVALYHKQHQCHQQHDHLITVGPRPPRTPKPFCTWPVLHVMCYYPTTACGEHERRLGIGVPAA